MLRTLVAALIGAVVLFAWGAVYWMFIIDKSGAIRSVPNEAAIVGNLKTNIGSSAVYMFPAYPEPNAGEAAMQDFARRYKEGPVGAIIYRAEGGEHMPPSMMARGFLINLASAVLVTIVLQAMAAGGLGFARRWAIAIMFGLFAALSTDALRGNWMPFPEPWTRALMFETIVAWVLAGGVISALCKAPSPAAK
jgi:hypothetical protein